LRVLLILFSLPRGKPPVMYREPLEGGTLNLPRWALWPPLFETPVKHRGWAGPQVWAGRSGSTPADSNSTASDLPNRGFSLPHLVTGQITSVPSCSLPTARKIFWVNTEAAKGTTYQGAGLTY
jgi:hypothetical protein